MTPFEERAEAKRSFAGALGDSISLPSLSSEERINASLEIFAQSRFQVIKSLNELRSVATGRECIVYDTEYTTWPGAIQRGWSNPGEYRELVQIGAIKIDLVNGDGEYSAFNQIIKPRINPVLSEYFVNLTGITQARVDREGVSFEDALIKLYTFCEGGTLPLLSYGQDGERIVENARLYGVQLPDFPGGLFDSMPLFDSVGIDSSQYSSGTIYQALGIPLKVNVHDGLDDARSLGAGLRKLLRLD